MAWYKRLKIKMDQLGMKGVEVARRAGVEPKTLYKYLEGKIDNPRGKTLANLAKVLGTTEEWLRYGGPEPESRDSNGIDTFIAPDSLQVPVLSEKIFVSLIKGEIDYFNIFSSSQVMPYLKKDKESNRLAVIQVKNDHNYPDLKSGDQLYVDIEHGPELGKYCVTVIDDILLVAIYTLAIRDKKTSPALKFANDDIDTIHLDDIDCQGPYFVCAVTKYQ